MAERSELGWAQLFAELARELEIACTTEARLHRIAELATSVTGCTWAAIAMATDQTPVVAATSDPDIGEHIAKLQAAAAADRPGRPCAPPPRCTCPT
jgi:hypothetical protein